MTAQAVDDSGEGLEPTGLAQIDAATAEAIVAALRTVRDPEIPTNIYDLGLIYAVEQTAPGKIAINMTLTAPGCPVAGTLPGEVQRAVQSVDAVEQCDVHLVWDPPWDRDRISDAAKLQLGLL